MEEPSLAKIEFEDCNWRKSLQSKTIRKLKHHGFIDDKDTKVHISVTYKATGNVFIGVLNCNTIVREPKYLVFYDGIELKLILDRFNLDVLYEQFKQCDKSVWNADRSEIWEYIVGFTKEELYNKENPFSTL